MKTLSKIVSEIYAPNPNTKNNPEVRFIAKHVIQQFGVKDGKDYAGNSVDGPPYKATNKPVKRATEHGYDPGQDEKVYESKVITSVIDSLIEKGLDDDTIIQNLSKHLKEDLDITESLSFIMERRQELTEEVSDEDRKDQYYEFHDKFVQALKSLDTHIKSHKNYLDNHAKKPDSIVSYPHHEMKHATRQLEDLLHSLKERMQTKDKVSYYNTTLPEKNYKPKKHISGTKWSN